MNSIKVWMESQGRAVPQFPKITYPKISRLAELILFSIYSELTTFRFRIESFRKDGAL